MKKYKFHFIPNTHWDREWLYDFQETRMFLTEFMDKLLDIFKKYPEYKTYLLDSQTIPIEDYLQVRPERSDELIGRVKEKRLFIGPWYTLPEEHLVNGESLVRNLLYGHKLGEQYGGVMKVGYSPFSYGQASQMAQIYLGFGIDTILFYHGVNASETPAEFILEGADGSRILGSRMGSNARYNFYFAIYRPAVYGKASLERTYYWKEGGMPFHFASSDRFRTHHILVDPVKGLNKENLKQLMTDMKTEELKHATTENIACMQGMDSTQPAKHEMMVMHEAAKVLEKDEIFHSSLPEYMDALKRSLDWDKLTVLKGERRTPRQLGTRVHLYGDVTSARVRLKRKNAQAELELQRKAEPFSAISHLLGAEYPKSFLDLAWKYLLKCHPHDSIAGTGVDQIENDMHYRLDQCLTLSAGIERRALQNIQVQIDTSDLADDEVVLTVYNPSPFKRSEVISAVVDLPLSAGFKNYSIREALSGRTIAFQEKARLEQPAIVRHLGDATMEMPSMQVHLHIPLEDIPALGYTTLVFKPEEDFSWCYGSLISEPNVMENAYLKVEINANGTLNITDKENGKTFEGLHYFADNGEAGHAWRHVPPALDRVITTLNSTPQIELLEKGPYLSRYAVTHTMQIPAHLQEGKGGYIRRLDADGDDATRSQETRELKIRSEITLTSTSKGVHIKTAFNNTAEDHRLRVMFPSNLKKATHSFAEEPFDVVERIIDRNENNPWRNTWNPTHPHQKFVDVNDGQFGLAIINDGLREYEVTDDKTRTIALTLLRSFEVALTTVAWRWERHPEMKGSQSPGDHEFVYFIYPHKGGWDEGGVSMQAERFSLAPEAVQAGAHKGRLPKSHSFLEIDNGSLMLSAIKRAENDDKLVLRFYNPTKRVLKANISFFKNVKQAQLLNLNEETLNDGDIDAKDSFVSLEVEAKKIITLAVKL